MHTICFGACRIELGRREIWRDGTLHQVPLKVFDLLALLVQHEGQVVHKEALFQRIWGGRPVSDGVLANAVMKARKAIGDDAGAAAHIKTVHGVGYRFDASATEGAVSTAASATSLQNSGRRGKRRVGLLPFVNLTGEVRLAWTEIGLSTLTAQALEADSSLSVMPVATMLKAVDSHARTATGKEQAAAVRRMLGLDVVVYATLQREGTVLCLNYWALGEGMATFTGGKVAGGEPTDLGEQLAQRLVAMLSGQHAPTVRYDSEDSYVSETFARAMSFFAQRRWAPAMRLLEVVLELEPESTTGRLWLMYSLFQLGDGRCVVLGRQLLAEATARGDERLLAKVHVAMARALFYSGDDAKNYHLAEGSRLCQQEALEEEAIEAQFIVGYIAHWKGDFPTARIHYEQAEEASLASKNELRLLLCKSSRVQFEMDTGRLLVAKLIAEEVLITSKRYGSPYVSYNLANLAAIHAAFGFLAIASSQCEQSMAGLELIQDSAIGARVLWSAAIVCGETRDVAPLDRALKVCELLFAGQSAIHQSVHQMVRGRRAGCVGEFGLAESLMRTAIDTLEGLEQWWLQAQWQLLLLEIQLKQHHWQDARVLCRAIEALPGMRGNVEVQASVLRAQAAELHANGRKALAIERLLEAVVLTSAGGTNARSRIDAAWLCVETGDVPQAHQLLRPIEPWLAHHPLGLMVHARLRYAQGSIVEAAGLQRQAIETHGKADKVPNAGRSFFGALQVLYDAANPGLRLLPSVPALPGLL